MFLHQLVVASSLKELSSNNGKDLHDHAVLVELPCYKGRATKYI